jgi:hypothetical protein
MIDNWLLPLLYEEFRRKIDSQQYGAPPHYHNAAARFPDENLPGRWIGRGSPKAWPPTSPDVRHLWSFLWRCVKCPCSVMQHSGTKDKINQAVS